MCTLKHTDVSNLKSANLRFITLLLDAFQSLGSSVQKNTRVHCRLFQSLLNFVTNKSFFSS